jgi:hypothetical protein
LGKIIKSNRFAVLADLPDEVDTLAESFDRVSKEVLTEELKALTPGKGQVPGGWHISQTTKKLINKRRETWDRVRRA